MKRSILAFLLCLAMIFTFVPEVSAVFQERPGETLLYNFTFSPEEKADIERFFTPNEAVEIEWVSGIGVGHGDDHALRVENIDKVNFTSVHNVVRLTLPEPLPLGYEYRVFAWIYAPEEGNDDKRNMRGPNICINNNYEGDLGVSKFPADYGGLTLGQWRSMDAVIPVQTTETTVIDFRLYTNNAREHPNIWYWDNIEIWQGAHDENIRVPEWDLSLPSLAETYSDYFLIGNIMTPNSNWFNAHTDAFLHHFNAVTAENSMKPVYVALESGQYDFNGADTVVKFGEDNNIPVHGHTLIWHQQSADWLTTDPDGNPLTRDEARENMQSYITAYAGRYAGRIASWDVVNEAFDNSVADGTNWKSGMRTASPWYKAYANGTDRDAGEHPSDYIYDAFVFTRLAAPDAVLFYNDFNEEEPGKRNAMAGMAEDFNVKWETDPRNTEPGRKLIEGMGMQSHYWTDNLNPADVRDSIQRFVRAGLRIRITELDIPFGNYGNYRSRTTEPTEAELIVQAKLYESLFKIYIDFAEHIDAVTIWGLTDPMNWRGSGYPVLFDEFQSAKPSFWSIIEVVDPGAYDRFMGTQPSDSESTSAPAPDHPDGTLIQPVPDEPDEPHESDAVSSGFPWWGFALIGVGVAILVAFLAITVIKNKKAAK